MHVLEFAAPTDEINGLLAYPFRQPSQNYLTDGEAVSFMPDTYDSFCQTVDAYLESQGLPLVSERIPIVAYGANASPARLQQKMAAYGPAELQPNLQTAPNIMATIENTAIVWHGRPDQVGSTFAELYKGPGTEGMAAHCFVQFMTAEQVALLHATEGITYHVVDVVARAGLDERPIAAKAYVAGQSEILLKDSQPVRVRRPGTEQTGSAMTAEEAVSYMLDHVASEGGTKDVRDYIAEGMKLDLSEKKERQALVGRALAAAGLSRTFTFPGANSNYYGRADFTDLSASHPKYYQVAEQSLAHLRTFRDGVLDRQVKDIMPRIRLRATRELEERIGRGYSRH